MYKTSAFWNSCFGGRSFVYGQERTTCHSHRCRSCHSPISSRPKSQSYPNEPHYLLILAVYKPHRLLNQATISLLHVRLVPPRKGQQRPRPLLHFLLSLVFYLCWCMGILIQSQNLHTGCMNDPLNTHAWLYLSDYVIADSASCHEYIRVQSFF